MIKLPSDFELDKYGLHVRLVHEEDAEFIVHIRTNPHNAQYIHYTDSNINVQVEWIRKYKLREEKGQEYYLLFEKDGLKQGVYRIYNRYEDCCVTGSWVFSPDADKFSALKGFVITHEIVFGMLGNAYVHDKDGVNEKNTKVLAIMRLIGGRFDAIRLDPKGRYQTLYIYAEDFYKNRPHLLKCIGINVDK